MLPLTVGFLVAGPAAGWLSDRYGARPFSVGGMLLAAASFGFLMLLPANFGFPVFALLLLMNGVGMGLFAAPNTTGIMNSVPAGQRGPHRACGPPSGTPAWCCRSACSSA
ncbi:MAG TPA: MFS transporter [Acidimicrobiales bacterium]